MMSDTLMPNGTRRRHIRLGIHEGVTAEFRVTGIGHRPVHTREGKVLLLNISPGGVRFASSLFLSTDLEWRVALRFILEGVRLEVRGRVRHAAADNNWWEYGIQMDENPLMRLYLVRAINQRLLNRSPVLSKIHQLYDRSMNRAAPDSRSDQA